MAWSRVSRLSVAVLVLGAAGCVRKHVENDTSEFTYEWWVGALGIVGGLALLALGVFVLTKKRLYWGAVGALGGVAALVATPTFFTDHATVSDSQLVTTEGPWFARSVAKIKFDDLEEVRVNVTESRRRWQTRKNYSLVFKMKERGAQQVALGDIERAAFPEIMAQLQRRNIAIRGLDQLAEDIK